MGLWLQFHFSDMKLITKEPAIHTWQALNIYVTDRNSEVSGFITH